MSKIFKSREIKYDKDDVVWVNPTAEVIREMAEPEVDETEAEQEEQKVDPLLAARVMGEEIVRMAKDDARAVLQAAEAEAAELMERTRREAEELYEQSKKEGYDYGYTDGMDATQDSREEAERVLTEARKKRDETLEGIEEDILNLIIETTRKLIGVSADIDPRVIINLIRQGLADASVSENVKIHVSKEDYDDAVERKDEIDAVTPGGARAELVKNLSLSKGDCIIETAFGNIDCSLDGQFAELTKNLRYIFAGKTI